MKKIQPPKSHPFMQNSGPLSFYFPIFLQPVYIDFSTPSTARQPCKNKMNFIFYYQSRILLHFYRACSQMRDAKISHSTVTNHFI